MALIADSGALFALYDRDDAWHDHCRRTIESEPGPIIVPSGILAEIDYLLVRSLGVDAELDFLDALAVGTFQLEQTTAADLQIAREIITAYRAAAVGLSDALVVATARRSGVNRIFTVDARDFRTFRDAAGRPFTLLPLDLITAP